MAGWRSQRGPREGVRRQSAARHGNRERRASQLTLLGCLVLLGATGWLAGCAPGEPTEAPTTSFSGKALGALWHWVGDEPTTRVDLRTARAERWHRETARIDLDSIVRPSRLARVGSALEWELPAGAGTLEVSVGWDGEQAVHYRILDLGFDGAEPANDVGDPGEASVLATGELPRTSKQKPAEWHPVRIELAAAGGDTDPGRQVRFETWSEPETTELGSELVAWGSPIWTPSNAPVSAAPRAGRRKPPINVVLVSIDTLRADRMSLYGYDRETTERLRIWAGRRAVVFESATAAAPWTLPSHVSMLSGLDPLNHPIHHDIGNARGRDMPRMLGERLRDAGYRTLAVTGGAYLHPRYGFDRGFEAYRSWPNRGQAHAELADGVDRVLDWVEERGDAPFFAFLHTYATHDPYRPRPPFFDRWAPDGLDWPLGANVAVASPKSGPEGAFRKQSHFERRFRGERTPFELPRDAEILDALYDSNVAHADQQVFRLLRGLDALGLRNRTLVLITSDHGEALGDRGGDIGHAKLYEHTLHVPLIIALPDRRGAGQRIETPVASVDLVPTVLDVLGLQAAGSSHGEDPPVALDGQSLLPWIGAPNPPPRDSEARAIWSYAAAPNWGVAMRRGDRKAIVDVNAWRDPETSRYELYDLSQDPTELDNLSHESTEALDPLHRQLSKRWIEDAQGLRLRLQNPGPGILRGTLEGAMVRPVGTKSLDLDCACLTWRSMGEARFEIGPGEGFTLLFEKVLGRTLQVRGELRFDDRRHPLAAVFEVEDAAGVVWDGNAFVATDPASVLDSDSPGLALDWVGAPRIYAGPATEEDAELLRQLEALGYL